MKSKTIFATYQMRINLLSGIFNKAVWVLFLLLCMSIQKESYAQGTTCATATAFCTAVGTPFTYVNSTTGDLGAVRCLQQTYGPNWFYVRTTTPGTYVFNIKQSTTSNGPANIDVDFIAFGPYSSPQCTFGSGGGGLTNDCSSIGSPYGDVEDCSYCWNSTETMTLNPSANCQFYMILVTNYSRTAGYITFTQTSGPATDCNITGSAPIPNWTTPAPMCTTAPSVNLNTLLNAGSTTGGTWSGTGVVGSTFNPATAGVGVHNVTYSIGVGLCPASQTQSITVMTVPVANAGPDQNICATTATLTGNVPSGSGSGTWSLVSGTGTIASSNVATTSVTGLGSGANVFQWTITNACGTHFDQVSISISTPPVISSSFVCNGSDATLTVAGCTGTLQWQEWGSVPSTTPINDAAQCSACGGTPTSVFGIYVSCSIGSSCPTTVPGWVNIGTNPSITVTPPYATQYQAICTGGVGCIAQQTVTVNCSSPMSVAVNSASICNSACTNIAATVTGGTAPFTYAWSTGGLVGAGPNNVCPAGTTTYTVTVTDAASNTATASGIVTVGSAINTGVPVTVQPTCGSTNGSVNIVPSGGAGGYTYLWSPGGATSSSITNLGTGTYNVTVTDAAGCTATTSASLSSLGGPSVSVTVTNIPCVANSGTATVVATGGNAPYTYLWSNGPTTTSINGLSGGTYTISVTDASSCVSSIAAVITSQTPVSVNISGSQMIMCYGANSGGATATVTGGAAPITYLWTSGESTAIATSLPAGVNGVLVTDVNGCQDTASITITQGSPMQVYAHGTNPSCGSACNGTLAVDVIGGTLPYTFLWSGGVGNTANVSNVCAGTYTVTVTDASGCVAPTATVPSACFEIQSILVDACQTTEGYQEMVFFQVGPNAVNTSTLNVTWASANAWNGVCTDPTFIVNVNATITGGGQLISPVGGVIPAGANVVLITSSGLLTQSFNSFANLSGPLYAIFQCGSTNTGGHFANFGTGTRTYTMNFGGGCSDAVTYDRAQMVDQSGTHIAADGAYVNFSYTGTPSYENYGCVAPFTIQTSSVTLGGASPMTTTVVETSPQCNGGLTGAANLTVTGGIAPLTYNWSNGATTQDLASVSAGTYFVTITDATTCTINDTAILTQPVAMVASVVGTNLLCNGINTGTATSTITGGVSPYTYIWTNGATTQNLTNIGVGLIAVTVTDANSCTTIANTTIQQPAALIATIVGSNIQCSGGNTGAASLSVTGGTIPYIYAWSNSAITQNISGLASGNYIVTVTDSSACVANANVTIVQNAVITSNIISTSVPCNGDLTGAANLTVAGGATPFIYVWSNGAITEDLTSVGAGTYFVTATDANTCSIIDTVIITQPAAMSVVLTGVDLLCNGINTGAVSTVVAGGIVPYTYSWSNSSITQNLTNVGAGPYTVTVKDANFCTANASVTIVQPSALGATASVTANQCFGDNTGAITLSVTGGTPVCTYLWSNGFTTQNISSLTSGTYVVTVKDANNCTKTISATIIPPSALSASINGPTHVSCNGGNNGTATVTVTGGTSTSTCTFSWNTAPAQTSATATGLIAGVFTVTVVDTNLCSATSNVTITEPIVLSNSVSTINPLCFNGNNGSIDLSVSGGTIPYIYSWSNGATTQDLNGILAGVYDATVTDAHLCISTASVTITQPAQLIAATGSVTNLSCYGGNDGQATVIASGGIPPYAYSWSTNPAWNQPSISNLSTGTVIATVKDVRGCIATHSIVLTAPQSITSSPSPDAVICKGGSATLTMNAIGGTLPYLFHWNTGEITSTIQVSPNAATSYTCYVTDGNNCAGGIQTITVNVLPPVQLDAVTYDDHICPNDSVEIHLNATYGVPPYLMSLADGTVISTPYYASLKQTDRIYFQVKDKCNSFDTSSVLVYVYPFPQIHIIADKYSGCSPLLVNFFETSPNVGQTYIWHFDDNDENNLSMSKNPSHKFDIAGNYDISLTITSVNGCKKDTTVYNFIHAYPLPDARFIFSPDIPKIITPVVEFTNLSQGYVVNYWLFGDGDSSLVTNPNHTYRAIGDYVATLIVFSDKGCKDTTKQIINVQDFYTLYAPTAFSPDKDDKNDVFYVYGSGILDGTFKLMIYDRWGEIIFSANDIHNGWDGKQKGVKVQMGSYVWLAVFKDFMGNEKTVTGKVTVVR